MCRWSAASPSSASRRWSASRSPTGTAASSAGSACRPTAAASATVVVWGGLSGWGAAYLGAADAFTARGLACLLAEGPGQGEPRLSDRLYVDEHVTDGFARFLDAVAADPRLGEPVGVQGNSFGGLFAAHLAAQDPRVGACVVNGAPAAATTAAVPHRPRPVRRRARHRRRGPADRRPGQPCGSTRTATGSPAPSWSCTAAPTRSSPIRRSKPPSPGPPAPAASCGPGPTASTPSTTTPPNATRTVADWFPDHLS